MDQPAVPDTALTGIHALPQALVDMLAAWDAESETLVVACRQAGPRVTVVGSTVPIS